MCGVNIKENIYGLILLIDNPFQLFRRELLIENQADFVVLSIKSAAGAWITSRVSHCQKLGKEALSTLKQLSISRESLETQWDLQKDSLTNIKQST